MEEEYFYDDYLDYDDLINIKKTLQLIDSGPYRKQDVEIGWMSPVFDHDKNTLDAVHISESQKMKITRLTTLLLPQSILKKNNKKKFNPKQVSFHPDTKGWEESSFEEETDIISDHHSSTFSKDQKNRKSKEEYVQTDFIPLPKYLDTTNLINSRVFQFNAKTVNPCIDLKQNELDKENIINFNNSNNSLSNKSILANQKTEIQHTTQSFKDFNLSVFPILDNLSMKENLTDFSNKFDHKSNSLLEKDEKQQQKLLIESLKDCQSPFPDDLSIKGNFSDLDSRKNDDLNTTQFNVSSIKSEQNKYSVEEVKLPDFILERLECSRKEMEISLAKERNKIINKQREDIKKSSEKYLLQVKDNLIQKQENEKINIKQFMKNIILYEANKEFGFSNLNDNEIINEIERKKYITDDEINVIKSNISSLKHKIKKDLEKELTHFMNCSIIKQEKQKKIKSIKAQNEKNHSNQSAEQILEHFQERLNKMKFTLPIEKIQIKPKRNNYFNESDTDEENDEINGLMVNNEEHHIDINEFSKLIKTNLALQENLFIQLNKEYSDLINKT